MRLSLTQRLFAVTGLALVPAIAVVISNVVTLREAREQEIHAEAFKVAELAALEMERILSGTENILRVIAAAPVISGADEPACSAFLKQGVASLPHLASIAVVNPDGKVRCRPEQSMEEMNVRDRPYFRTALETSDRVTGIFTVGKRTGRNLLPIALRYQNAAGIVDGVIVAFIDLEWLQSRIRERTYANGSSLTIADKDGRILAREPDPKRFVGTVIPEQFQRLVNAETPGTEKLVSQDGTSRVIGYVPAAHSPEGIYVSTGISTDTAFRSVTDLAVIGIVISILGTLAAFLLAAYTSKAFIIRPFARLIETIDAWRDGNTNIRTDMSLSEGEIGRVGSALDAFMDELLVSRAARIQAEDQRRLLGEELNHRVKNLLAMVQVVARQTFADKAPAESVATFTARLQAMGSANTLLLQDNWQSAPLRDVVEKCIGPFLDPHSPQITVRGPPLLLPSGIALAIGMALHELCTNAAKYGALSVSCGRVDLSWLANEDPSGERFTLIWTEQDGPTVSPPQQTGFGSKIIERVLAQQIEGTVDVTYRPEGLTCVIRGSLGAHQKERDPKRAD